MQSEIEIWEIGRAAPFARNPRKNDAAVDKMAASIAEFGFKIPVLARSNGEVFKGTKTEQPRKVELPPSMLDCLETHRKSQNEFRRQFGPDYRSDLDLIFANPDGSPLMPNSVSATVSRLCKRLGLPEGASLHVLRHSHASLLLENGVDIATISESPGHSSVRTTADIYSHAIRGKDRAAAQCWDRWHDIWRRHSSRNPTVSGWITLARSMPTCRSDRFGSTSPVRSLRIWQRAMDSPRPAP
jgi:hypothetical protein